MGSILLDDDQWREYQHVSPTPELGTNQEQWVNWGDHTITVDPMKFDHWIMDHGEQHVAGQKRGRMLDRKLVSQLQGWQNESHQAPYVLFTPSQSTIAGLDRFSVPLQQGCRVYRGVKRDESRFGMLPSISAQLYDNVLPNKSTSEIEHEMLEEARLADERLFDRTYFGSKF